MTYKRICSTMNTHSQTEISNRSGRERFGLTISEQKKLCNKTESEDFPDDKYQEFIKNAKWKNVLIDRYDTINLS